MISYFIILALGILALSILGCMYRLLKGPTIPDRIIALDTIGVMLLAMMTLLCVLFRTTAYFDIVLLIGILTFIGTTAFARYIERGDILE
ncbi:multicomponent Na+:H+ antiporter subunit F [Paenibacillus sp. UNCCL117]|uniref:Na(+)/H(+) antiporter subunit F1 n=1 Tax=unclassified Paenibacillus TaxID=185978 RepID=UPI0008883928|nr:MULTISPECIES: Na(+)/H(+) antiporter subunit F1 [unclassified Paenibacillus]SDC18319.1 multisubunit sodium/proton antiporter, MrpF subunit [Paenibacillus sp. cl123]SFW18181.1 multicomponent Na+:H+ antiporter subunit F [Paenibacillus sp. UNCCL117]